jgi:hypothetical protein
LAEGSCGRTSKFLIVAADRKTSLLSNCTDFLILGRVAGYIGPIGEYPQRSMSMEPPISPLLFAILLFIGMVALIETGRRFGVRRRAKESDN